jgi:septum formation protein
MGTPRRPNLVMNLSKKLVLGSQSPRRAQFLKDLELDFRTLPLDVDETAPSELNAIETAIFVSELKANALLPLLAADELGITSDTEVWLENRRYGKPSNYEEAFDMIQTLSGKTHLVVSGLSVIDPSANPAIQSTSSVVEVTFNHIPEWAIHHYINTYSPFDKAGAYGIQEWIGQGFISEIKGNYNSVVGLDTAALVSFLTPYIK